MTSPDADRSRLQLDRPRKLQRISQACDLCHRRSIRCRPSNERPETQCQNCYDFAVDCTYNRPSKRRKHQKGPDGLVTQLSAQQSPLSASAPQSGSGGTPVGQSTSSFVHQALPRDSNPFSSTPKTTEIPNVESVWRLRYGPHVAVDSPMPPPGGRTNVRQDHQFYPVSSEGVSQQLSASAPQPPELSVAWRAFAQTCETAIGELLAIYMDAIYPTYPLFHESRLETRIRSKEYLHDRGFFAAVMAACALVSARISDKAVPSSYQVRISGPHIPTENFYAAASESISKNMAENPGVEYMRACTLLALTCLQQGNVGGMQQYIGTFFTLVAVQRFFDEKYWPRGLSDVELEINRRVYWCTYCLDISASAIWSGFMRSQEVHAGVRYPSDLSGDKEDTIYHSGTSNLPRWVVGWHFTIDLHRVMEHILNKYRARQFQHSDRRGVDHLVFGDNFNDVNVMQTTLGLYHNLPSVLKETPHLTGDASLDVYGYQAANIQATLQLMRMIMLTLEEGDDIERRCEVVGEVLGVFSSIPVDYLRAINTPLIFHLGTIGQILMAVRHESLSETSYRRLRAALATMADLLDNLGPGVSRFIGPSQTIRQQVSDLDAAMRSKRTSQGLLSRASGSSLGGAGSTSSLGLPQCSLNTQSAQQQQQQQSIPQSLQLPQLQQQEHQQQQQQQHHQQQQQQQQQHHHAMQQQQTRQQQRGSTGPSGSIRNSMTLDTNGDTRFATGLMDQTGPRPADYTAFPPELMGNWSLPVIYDQNDVPPIYQPPPAPEP